jgi:antitoxin component YwqK of YwqJK toxin-antitoxin module
MLGILATASWCSLGLRVDRNGNPGFAEVGGLLYYRGQPFSGVQVERFPDGRPAIEIGYRDGLKDGESREYATTGALRSRLRYRAGKREGLQESWFIEGPKRSEEHYKNGMLDGVQTEWHLSGAVFKRQTYADGIETARKILYPTAEVYSNYVKRDGRVFGVDGGELCFRVKPEGER